MCTPMSTHTIMASDVLREQLYSHAMSCFPEECCGLLVSGEDGPRVVLSENLANHYHQRDPHTYPRDATESYVMNPLEIVAAEKGGETIVAIFHSHCGTGAYFSNDDLRAALCHERQSPLHPGTEYVVLDARQAGVHGFKVFAWSPFAEDFVEQ